LLILWFKKLKIHYNQNLLLIVEGLMMKKYFLL